MAPRHEGHSAETLTLSCSRHHTIMRWHRLLTAGQALELPVHNSSSSHTPIDSRHTTELLLKPSAGHRFEVPVHFSSSSQGPSAGRQTVPCASTSSGPQSGEVPEQYWIQDGGKLHI